MALAGEPARLAARGSAVVVTVDYGAGSSVPLPDAVRARIEAIEVPRFELWRQDDNDNEVRIRGFFSREAAEAEAERFTALGHKQSYWVVATGS